MGLTNNAIDWSALDSHVSPVVERQAEDVHQARMIQSSPVTVTHPTPPTPPTPPVSPSAVEAFTAAINAVLERLDKLETMLQPGEVDRTSAHPQVGRPTLVSPSGTPYEYQTANAAIVAIARSEGKNNTDTVKSNLRNSPRFFRLHEVAHKRGEVLTQSVALLNMLASPNKRHPNLTNYRAILDGKVS